MLQLQCNLFGKGKCKCMLDNDDDDDDYDDGGGGCGGGGDVMHVTNGNYAQFKSHPLSIHFIYKFLNTKLFVLIDPINNRSEAKMLFIHICIIVSRLFVAPSRLLNNKNQQTAKSTAIVFDIGTTHTIPFQTSNTHITSIQLVDIVNRIFN